MTASWLGLTASLVALEIAGPLTAWSRPRRVPRPALGQLRWVALGVALVVGGSLAPPVVLVGGVGWGAARHLRHHRARRDHERAVRQALPDLVDLLRLATTAGLALPIAHQVVLPHVAPPIGAALAAADTAASRGQPRADALVAALAPFGERAHALAHVLSDHLRYGVPLLPGLERNGLELRLDRRRAAELEARRVPVRLLGPLVTCVLPAFGLLTVVPLIAASFEALPA